MAYVYDEELGEWYEDGDMAVDVPADTGLASLDPSAGPAAEDDRRFEEDWDDALAGRLTIEDVVAQHPEQASGSLYDSIASGAKAAVDWALKTGGDAVKKAVMTDGKIDYAKLASIGVGLATYATGNKTPSASGYQGSIPKMTAERAAVPGTYDPNRAAGSGGQRYFSDVVYGGSDSVADRAAKAQAQAAELAARNRANSANRAPLAVNLRPPKSTETMGATPSPAQAAPAGIASGAPSTSGASAATGIASFGPGYGSVPAQQAPSGITSGAAPQDWSNSFTPGNTYIKDAEGNYQFVPGGRASVPAGVPTYGSHEGSSNQYMFTQPGTDTAPRFDPLVAQALNSALPGRPLSADDYAYWTNHGGLDAIAATFGGSQAPTPGAVFGGGISPAPAQPAETYAAGGNVPKGLASLPQDTIYNSKEPRYLKGASNGQADELKTTIDGHTPAALSHGEFVIPADVVGALGGGNSDAGAKTLYSMMDRVRQQATGSKQQMKAVNHGRVLPA